MNAFARQHRHLETSLQGGSGPLEARDTIAAGLVPEGMEGAFRDLDQHELEMEANMDLLKGSSPGFVDFSQPVLPCLSRQLILSPLPSSRCALLPFSICLRPLAL